MRHRILALAILCALALQMELPAAHAPAHAGAQGAGLTAHGAQPLALRAARAAHAPAHDPASCPICRSLHAKPVVPLPPAPESLLPEQVAVLPTPAQPPHANVVREGHPPRAPPRALSLA